MSEYNAPTSPGMYRHYKGNVYEVIGIGKDTETEEEVVIYRPVYSSDVDYWVRPRAMFEEKIIVDGKTVNRFERIDTNDE